MFTYISGQSVPVEEVHKPQPSLTLESSTCPVYFLRRALFILGQSYRDVHTIIGGPSADLDLLAQEPDYSITIRKPCVQVVIVDPMGGGTQTNVQAAAYDARSNLSQISGVAI